MNSTLGFTAVTCANVWGGDVAAVPAAQVWVVDVELLVATFGTGQDDRGSGP